MSAAQQNLAAGARPARATALRKIADEIPAALGDRGRRPPSGDQPDRRPDAGVPGLRRRLLPARRSPNQAGARRRTTSAGQTDRRRASSCPTLAGSTRAVVANALGAHRRQRADRRAGARPARPRPRSRRVGAIDAAAGARRVNHVPARRQRRFTVKFANQGDNDETDVMVTVAISGAGKPITRDQDGQPDEGQAAEPTVDVPLGQSPPIGTPVTVTVEVVKVPGETEHRQQQRRPTPRSSAPVASPRPIASPRGRPLPRRPGIVALAAGAARAGRAGRRDASLAVRLRRLRAAQRRCSATTAPRTWWRTPRELERGFARCTTTSRTSPPRWTARCDRRAAARRRDRLPRPGPLRRLQRDVRAASRRRSRCSTRRARGSCSRRSTTASRRGCTPSRSRRPGASSSSRPRRTRPCASPWPATRAATRRR